LDLVKRFETNDDLFQKWLANFNTQMGGGKCVGSCKQGFICQMLSATVDLYEACMI